MGKQLFIAEKPSVAAEFAKALKLRTSRRDGYMESEEAVVTWCVGHLVTMSYPEAYDPNLKRWSLDTLPFLPETFLYEVIPAVKKQFEIVKGLLNRQDVDVIYVCTDSGREGEYIYRLVEQMSGVRGKQRKRIWIDSQTEEEILRGIEEAKDLSEYDNLSASAYLRAKEDYLMGINFSRLLTLKYGNTISNFLRADRTVISVGRVMTCVLGMIVRREREIREFVKMPFYRVLGKMNGNGSAFEGEWKVWEGSKYFQYPHLYKENGFKKEEDAGALIAYLTQKTEQESDKSVIEQITRKTEKKNPPLLYNLAELQNDCSKLFKISPDETLRIVQELYEKKMVTYPRTDARVLSTAAAKEIYKNISGLAKHAYFKSFADEILQGTAYKNIARTRYVNDKQITDHYALIPTGQGMHQLQSLTPAAAKVYEAVARRFLAIFYPPAVYKRLSIITRCRTEQFHSNFKVLAEEGYLAVMQYSFSKKKESGQEGAEENSTGSYEQLIKLKKGDPVTVEEFYIKAGETAPPKRYNSGTLILAMENAGQLIEDEELRAQIKGSGIGTSATRAEILKKLIHNQYLALNKKTQIVTPTQLGEMIFDVVNASLRQLLNPELTASWEKGLTYVAEGTITPQEYMVKLEDFIKRRTAGVQGLQNQYMLRQCFEKTAVYYKK